MNDRHSIQKSLPKGWQIVRFDEIAESVNERVDPAETDLDVYVGLEHLDPESLKIRRWGTPDDVIGQKLGFSTGDIIFGKRRAYQRKLAVADCDGICSAHAMVLRAKTELVEPEFLPFFMQSDMFMERAVDISVGSLSPTINWKTLRIQEFPLPPKEEQRRIAEVIGASNETIDNYKTVLKELMSLKSISMGRFTTRGLGNPEVIKTRLGNISAKWKVDTIKNVTTLCQYGLSIPLHEKGQFPILRMMNYDNGEIVANDLKYVDLDEKTFGEFRLERSDILFNRTNSADLVGKVGIFSLEGDFVFASYLVRLRADTDKVLPEYLNAYLNSELGQSRLLAYATPGVSQTNISAGNLKKVLIPIPPIDEQIQIVRQISAISSKRNELLSHIERCQQLKRNLMQQFLMPKGLLDVQ